MAQLVPGSAGFIPGGGQTQQPDVAQTFMTMLGAVQNLKTAKQQEAAGKVDTILKLVQMGLDPNLAAPEFQKAIQATGIKLPDLSANQAAGAGGAQQPKGGAQAANASGMSESALAARPGGGVSPGVMNDGSGSFNRAYGTAQGQAQGGGGGAFLPMLQNVAQTAQAKRDIETERMANERMMLNLQNRVGNPENYRDPETGEVDREKVASDIGRLRVLQGNPITTDEMMALSMTGKDMKDAIALRVGGMSQAEKGILRANMLTAFRGLVKPEKLEDAAMLASEGKDIPYDYFIKDYSQQIKEAELFQKYTDAGLPGSVAKTAALGGGLSVLPEGVQTIAERGMAVEEKKLGIAEKGLGLQQQQLGIEAQRLGIEQMQYRAQMEHYKALAKAAEVEMMKEEHTALRAELETLINAKRAGYKIDPSIEQDILNRYAIANGMNVEEATGVLAWLGWAPKYKFVPRTSTVPGTKTAQPAPGQGATVGAAATMNSPIKVGEQLKGIGTVLSNYFGVTRNPFTPKAGKNERK